MIQKLTNRLMTVLAAILSISSVTGCLGVGQEALDDLKKRTLDMLVFVEGGTFMVDKALTVAQQNPEMLPMRFDLTEFERDVALSKALHPVSLALNKLNELVEGTLMAIGSDAYNTALDVYAYTKLTEGVTGLEGLRSALGNRFRSGQRRVVPAKA